jgi:hypothetical protein
MGSEIRCFFTPWIRDQDPGCYLFYFKDFFLKPQGTGRVYFSSEIRDEKCSDPESGMKKC